MSAIYDDMEEEAYKEKTHKRTKKIIEIVTKILNIDIHSLFEYDNLIWLYENRKKILRNKKLIDLLG